MFVAGVIFVLLGFIFPPLWIVGGLLIVFSIFGDVVKVILSSLWTLISVIFGFSEEDKKEKELEKLSESIKEGIKEQNIENSVSLELERLSKLLEKGLLTQEEFDNEKLKVLKAEKWLNVCQE